MRNFFKKYFPNSKNKKNKGIQFKKINEKIKKLSEKIKKTSESKYYLKRKSQKIAKNF